MPTKRPLPPCPVEDCPRKARSVGAGSRCLKHGGPLLVGREVRELVLCKASYCSFRASRGDYCGLHELNATVERPLCAAEGCGRIRQRVGGLCQTHYLELRSHFTACAHPLCDLPCPDECCTVHATTGIDLAAGDWYDHVAVERLWWGRQGARKPTLPEVRAALQRAAREGVSAQELGKRTGVGNRIACYWAALIHRLDDCEVAA